MEEGKLMCNNSNLEYRLSEPHDLKKSKVRVQKAYHTVDSHTWMGKITLKNYKDQCMYYIIILLNIVFMLQWDTL